MRPKLRPAALAPYFVIVAIVHLAAIATRFDTLAAKLPDVVAPAVMLSQFPLLMLSGYFESRLDHGEQMAGLPQWMTLKSKPLKLALTFGFIYLALVPLQTWDVSIGPLDPTPPTSFPEAQRAMWFAMFSVGMFFPFYLAATGLLLPVLRVMTWPLQRLPAGVGAPIALAAGFGIGALVLALTTAKGLGDFIRDVVAQYKANPAIGIAVSLVLMVGPMVIGLLRDEDQ